MLGLASNFASIRASESGPRFSGCHGDRSKIDCTTEHRYLNMYSLHRLDHA